MPILTQQPRSAHHSRCEQPDSVVGTGDSTSPRQQRSQTLPLLLCLLLLSALLGLGPIYSADTWWHLKAGEIVVTQFRVPAVDEFTYTNAGRPWVDLHWGFQAFAYSLYQSGGLTALSFFQSLLFTAAVLLGWKAGEGKLPAAYRLAIWIFPVLCMSSRIMMRPELVTLVCLAAMLSILHASRNRSGFLWLLPALQVIWVNCHGLFILGPIVLACWLADQLFERLRTSSSLPDESEHPASVPQLLMIFAATTGACLLNPYGLEGFLFPLTLFRKLSVDREIYAGVVGEFQPLFSWIRERGFMNVDVIALLGSGLIVTASFLTAARRSRFSLFGALLCAAFGYLACTMVRNVNLFGLICGVVSCQNFQAGWQHSNAVAMTRRRAFWESSQTRLLMASLMAVLMCGVTSNTIYTVGGRPGWFTWGEPEDWFAHGAAEIAGREGMPASAFIASFGQAAPYLYHNGPAKKVFLDGRLEVADVKTFSTYLQVKRLMSQRDRKWEDLVRDPAGELPAVILDKRSAPRLIQNLARTPGWRPVFQEPAAVLFLPEHVAAKLKMSRIELE
ncbi:hypothetical protein SH661x_004292 [Planctomicrobium sp. SH661]|uniref:hypothetical protein n=1 Tax=Planctomicrobium sp. SH661 TaxID=3448124 RepID=UPI003F5C8605